jgi:serine/threonine-protein kinase
MSNEPLNLVPNAPEPTDPLLGKVLDGRYRIDRMLGEGGMGIVYKAQHVALNKPLAIKVLRAEVSKDQEIVQRFRQEAQSATAIGNHHIIDISDFGVMPDGSTYFVMEFLDGMPLAKAIEPGKALRAARTIHIAKQLCRALGAAHDVGIVHRDLKPDNVYLINRGGDRDFVKVLDFGIAKVGGTKSKLTQVGQVFGTPHYMSPEQCAGTPVDKRTDVYALGVIMYEMASSRVPFDADNLMGILTKHLYEEPVPPRELPPPVDAPPALESVIMRCLAKKVDARYQSMQEVLDDLERVEQGTLPSVPRDTARRVSNVDPVQAVGTARTLPRASTESVDLGDGTIPGGRSNTGLLVGAAAAVLLLGGGALYAMRGGSAPAEETPSASAGATAPTQPATQDPPASQGPQAEPPSGPKDPADLIPQPPVVAPAVQVEISTEPKHTDVYADGALVGHTAATPYALARPRSGEPTVELTFRAEGYKDFVLRVTSLTQPKLSVELEREKRRTSGSNGGARPAGDKPPTSGPAPAQAKPVEAPKPPAEEPAVKPRPSAPTDVIDPWMN